LGPIRPTLRLLSPMLCAGMLLQTAEVTAEPSITPFSGLDSLAENPHWQPLEFPGIKQLTDYSLVEDAGVQVVRANTSGGASGLITRLRITPGDALVLRWRWKVSNVFEQGDARSKSGDDYPARIYVAFAFQPSKAGWFERTKRKAAAMVFGEELPGNALNYIWANKVPEGTVLANPYTDQTMMVAVNSGSDQAGQWVWVERDIVADYRKAFGEDPPALTGIAIMSDSDNTGETASAWYGDISLNPGN